MEQLLKWSIINSQTQKEDAAENPNKLPPKKLDPAIIDHILGKPVSQQMIECLDTVKDSNCPLDTRESALDNIEMFVESIDNASNLEPLNMWPGLMEVLKYKEPSLRSGCLWVCGTAVQHNNKAQRCFKAHGGLELATEILENDKDMKVKSKAMYCISSYVRNNYEGFVDFFNERGYDILKTNIVGKSEVLCSKSLFLLTALVQEVEDLELSIDQRIPESFIGELVKKKVVESVVQMISSDILSADCADKALHFLAALSQFKTGDKAIRNIKIEGNVGLSFPLKNIKSTFPDFVVDENDLSMLDKYFK